MDDAADPAREARFVPDRRTTGLAAGGAVVAVLLLLTTTDRAGQLLAGIAALVLVGYVVGDLVCRPRLTVSPAGLVIRAPLTRARLDWSQVDDVRADTRVRLGLRSTTLEIDAGAVLAVLSRRALGADPERVAEVVRSFRPPG